MKNITRGATTVQLCFYMIKFKVLTEVHVSYTNSSTTVQHRPGASMMSVQLANRVVMFGCQMRVRLHLCGSFTEMLFAEHVLPHCRGLRPLIHGTTTLRLSSCASRSLLIAPAPRASPSCTGPRVLALAPSAYSCGYRAFGCWASALSKESSTFPTPSASIAILWLTYLTSSNLSSLSGDGQFADISCL